MNRSKMFLFLLESMPLTNYEWAKRTGITRATFGNNRKSDGKNIKVKTLRNMATICDLKLIQINPSISPNNKDALFRLEKKERYVKQSYYNKKFRRMYNRYLFVNRKKEVYKKENKRLEKIIVEQVDTIIKLKSNP
jgi:hypothetical protein